jgi:hypothetical protein
MSSIGIIFFALTMRALMAIANKKLWFEVIRYLAAGVPLFSIMLGFVENDGLTVIFSGICFFYFPFVISKKNKQDIHDNSSV